MTLTTAEVGENSDIHLVKHKASKKNNEGWVYENINIGSPEVIRTSAFVSHANESVVNCVEPNQTSSVLLKSVDLEKSDDPIAQHLICCNYCHKQRECSSYFKVLCCDQSFSHRCIDRNSMHSISNKTESTFYAR